MKPDPCQLIEDVIHISRQAGSRIMDIYAADYTVEEKTDRTPLTEADMAAHYCIVESLGKLTPDIPVLSEESADIPFRIRTQWQQYWLVDPLDGTREFIKRNGEFTVNIALIKNHKPVMGVIHAPVADIVYAGVIGKSAWKQKGHQERKPITVRNVPKALPVVAGSRSHRGNLLVKFLKQLGAHKLISMGSSLKSCLVAEGKADIYPRFGPTSEWDTGAAQAIVEAAGGLITTLDLQPVRYNTRKSLLNPHFIVIGDRHYHWQKFLPCP